MSGASDHEIAAITDPPFGGSVNTRGLIDTPADLFGFATNIADNVGGIVSIEDEQSHVLAYSPSREGADVIRQASLLERSCPPNYLHILRQLKVFERLRRSDAVIEVPGYPEAGIQPRLVVGIRRPPTDRMAPGTLLGAIWVQQTTQPFAPDAHSILTGAATIAARMISRSIDAPSSEERLIQRLFGVQGASDITAVADALNMPATTPAVVVGFALTGGSVTLPESAIARMGTAFRLHASSFSRDSVSTVIGHRAYVLVSGHDRTGPAAVWVRHLVSQFETQQSIMLRAAMSVAARGLADAATARAEVDRVLDATESRFPRDRVTTLDAARTAVLKREILDLIAANPQLHDPRVDTLLAHDHRNSSSLCESGQAYLAHHGDVRAAAESLLIHPNTLRYRLKRLEEVLGMNLADPDDRLMFELQLALLRRGVR